MDETTKTQEAMLALVGVLTADHLWEQLKADRDGDSKALSQVASRMQHAYWEIESTERQYAETLAQTIWYAQQQQERLEKGEHTDASWTFGAANKALEYQVKLHAAIAQFRMFAAVRKELVESE